MASDQQIEFAASRIFDTFVVTREQAKESASGLVGLIEAKGGLPTQELIEDLFERHCGRDFEWRDAARRQRFFAHQSNKAASYNSHLDRARKDWSKKW